MLEIVFVPESPGSPPPILGSRVVYHGTAVNYGEINLIHWIDGNIYVQSAASQLTRTGHYETL